MKRLSLSILAIMSLCLCGCSQQAKQIARNDADFLAAVDSLNMAQRELVEWNNRDIAGLKEQSEHFDLENYIVIGDGREFSSPLEIMYDYQYTPSFVLIKPDGTLDRMVGEIDHIEEFLRK